MPITWPGHLQTSEKKFINCKSLPKPEEDENEMKFTLPATILRGEVHINTAIIFEKKTWILIKLAVTSLRP